MKKYLLILMFFSLWFSSHAAIEHFSERISPSSLTAGSTIDLYDHRYLEMNDPFWVNDFYNKRVVNKVKIGYEPDHFPLYDVDNSVLLQVEYWHLVSGVFVHTTVNKTLSIKFRANGQTLMDDISTFAFEDAHRVKVTVISIIGSNSGNIYVESEIEVERYYNMPTTMVDNSGHRYVGNADDYIEFYWDPVAGAESYELEWTFVSDYEYNTSSNTIAYADPQDLNFDFYKNSTRVDVLTSYYRIPAIFNHGYVIYRVRAVGRQGSAYEYRKESAWTMARSGDINSLTAGKIQITEDYEAGKNWQHQVSYTEGGKRFEGVSFSDGLGRGRQSVAHNTQTEQAVVTNVYYDRVGRPVVSDLPTPVDGNMLKHYPDFNDGVDLNSPGNPEASFGYVHFDYDAPGVCLPSNNPFATSKGAGQYYSSLNLNQEGANAFIPDAGGYPFAQVEYMNDQTGRIRRTGAYGPDHQLNAHGTQLFYDIPLQPELNKMFGTEVGKNEHYQRQLTVDANGQGYASYYDLAGRVIASCLIGEAPDALDALDNNTGATIEDNVVFEGTEIQITDEVAGIASYSYFQTVFTEADYTVNHTFTPEEFTDACLPEGFCYDCFYDLTLTVTNPVCPGEGDYSHTETINGWTVDEMCNGAGYSGTSALVHLKPGQYNISKTLRVSEGAAEAYWCNFISNSTCVPDYAALYNTAYDETDFGCVLPVEDATEMNTCDKYRRLLAIDMSLGGQYGNGELDALSIYKIGNTLPNGGNWRNPDGNYLDEYGNAVRIYITGSTGAYTPGVNDEGDIMTDADGNEYIYPENLADFADYEFYWRFSWSFALVKYHPEYCYLKYCDENLDFHLYDDEIGSIDSYDEACLLGYTDPIGEDVYPDPNVMNYFQDCGPNTSHLDPYFTSTEWQDISDYLEPTTIPLFSEAMDEFFTIDEKKKLSLWEYAVWRIHCSQYSEYEDIKDCIENAELTECEKDQVWRLFRDEYRKLRKHYYLLAQTFYVSYPDTYFGGGCGPAFNGCIGSTGYDPATVILTYGISPAYYPDLVSGPIAIPNTTGPCATTTAASYSTKTRRFENLPAVGTPQLPPGYSMDPTGLQDYITDMEADQCQTQCESYADEWMEKLAGCYATHLQRDNIRAALIEVCKGGCSAQNPGGATTDDPANGTPLTYETFGEVLAALGNSYQSAVCSEYLISTPRPFGQNDAQAATETKLESCGCDKLLQAEWDLEHTTPLPLGVVTVEDMLQWKTGIDLVDADAMICACKKAFRDTWTPESGWDAGSLASLAAAEVPAIEALTCKSCATCSDIRGHYLNFLEAFEDEENFESHENYEELFTNYMNNHLDYHLTLDEYQTFMEGCQATSEEPLCTTTNLARVFKDLLDVIARQGKLTTGSGTPYDMADANIVYQYSNLASILNGSEYWTCGTGCSPGSLEMYFGDDPGYKSIIFNLPDGADFDFDDIIGVSDISAVNSCGEDNIELEVRVVVCGEIVTRHITGSSENLALVTCYCESGSGTLCDAPYYAPASPCYAHELMVLASVTEEVFAEQVDEQHDVFVANYIAQCYSAFETEKLAVTGPNNFYQFTLFYYDQAGNLVKTVAPKGAKDNDFIANELDNVDTDRDGEIPNVPVQTYETKYEYNSYNQVIATSNPDQEGQTKFWYDRYGRIVASQNPLQADDGQYSYTLYDPEGRPVESGQVSTATTLTSTILAADDLGSSFLGWVHGGIRTEVNITQYDKPLSSPVSALFDGGQQNLRLRVASVLYFNSVTGFTDLTEDFASAIHYSYDVHGNVVESLQDVPQMAVVNQGIKSTQYEFELISGNVQKVSYQPGERDQMTHTYKYDQLNRLTEVFTSTDGGIHESREAHYRYYDYGPMARIEIGEHKVQGMDYAYTINGWMKGMNSSTLNPLRDAGLDGATGYNSSNTAGHENFARDVSAYTIGYFENDYVPIEGGAFEADVAGVFSSASSNLYNGNIRHTVTSIAGMEMATLGAAYRYDQLQRLKEMRVYDGGTDLQEDNEWSSATATDDYFNSYSYDENGNILTLLRNGISTIGLNMDNLSYKYIGLDNVPEPTSTQKSNRLDFVDDTGIHNVEYNAALKSGQATGNYTYDKIGQLTSDETEGIDEIEWFRGSKKVKKIIRDDYGSPEVEFVYNPFGIRILKIEKPRVATVVQPNTTWTYTFYSYDANGASMAVYETKLNTIAKNVTLTERNIYGTGRIGVVNEEKLVYSATNPLPSITDVKVNKLGNKKYEITNYLGNVNVVITDRKVLSSPGAASAYEAVIMMKSDYYPFGMEMPGRNESGDYRYGYNGMEKDDEVKGGGNSYTTEFRQYDPRTGRWLSLDPLMMQFPWMSPFVAFDNNPVYYIDPYGLESNGEPLKPGESAPKTDDTSQGNERSNSKPFITDHTGGLDTDQVKDRKTTIGSWAHKSMDLYLIAKKDPKKWFINKALGNNKRPDVIHADKGKNKGAVYELKPTSYVAKTKPLKQVSGYVKQANSQDAYGITGNNYATGTSSGLQEKPFNGILVLPSENGKYIFAYMIPDASNGMIYYYALNREEYNYKEVPTGETVEDQLKRAAMDYLWNIGVERDKKQREASPELIPVMLQFLKKPTPANFFLIIPALL